MKSLANLALFLAVVSYANGPAAAGQDAPRTLLEQSGRIAFLGDSITAAGLYVAYFDAWLVSQRMEHTPTVIDAGLPSETVSGLSEEGHADGKFPRPDLAERLKRVLAATKPDLVIACYGINCAIYQPFDEGRFKKYQQGIEHLKAQVESAGAKLVLMTPPFYDDQRSPRPFAYNPVLDRYSDWLLDRRKDGWLVIDLHGPMTREVRERRADDPKFTYQPDGVHPNNEGHWFIAQQLIRWFGDEEAARAKSPVDMLAAKKLPREVLGLVDERMRILKDAYVSAAGHKRPGVAAGPPVPEATAKAQSLSAKIEMLISQ
jgi:lysophospholipase L1-like esterase